MGPSGPGSRSYYYIGIIDVLQRYNMAKKLEHMAKVGVAAADCRAITDNAALISHMTVSLPGLQVWLKCQDPHGISCVPPDEYLNRFIREIKAIITIEDGQ